MILAAVLLVLALRQVSWPDVWSSMQGARPEYLGASCLIGTASYVVRALRWRVLLNVDKTMDAVTVFWATMAGNLGNSFLPARAGELIRATGIARRFRISLSFVLATAITERVADAVALLVLGSIAVAAAGELPDWLVTAVWTVDLIAVLALLILASAARMGPAVQAFLSREFIPAALSARALRLTGDFVLGIRTFGQRGRAVQFGALTLVIWLLDAVGSMVVAWALHLPLTLAQTLLLLALLGLASALPSTPGSLGIYQFVGVTLLPSFDFSQSQALAYMIVLQLMNYIVVTAWGVAGLWRLAVPIPDR